MVPLATNTDSDSSCASIAPKVEPNLNMAVIKTGGGNGSTWNNLSNLDQRFGLSRGGFSHGTMESNIAKEKNRTTVLDSKHMETHKSKGSSGQILRDEI